MKSETASHAAASLAANPRCAAQKVFTRSHVKDEPPMVAVAVLLKVAGGCWRTHVARARRVRRMRERIEATAPRGVR
eukprot:scaffold75990_cov48-Phaeocystis_antarctica.AAC.1